MIVLPSWHKANLKGYQKVTVMKLEKLETLEFFSNNICLPKKIMTTIYSLLTTIYFQRNGRIRFQTNFALLSPQRVGHAVCFPMTSGLVTWLCLLLKALKQLFGTFGYKITNGNVELQTLPVPGGLPGHSNGCFRLVTPQQHFKHLVSEHLFLFLPNKKCI